MLRGEKIVFYEDKKELFRGLIQKETHKTDDQLSIKAYDNGFFLAKNKDNYSYKNKTCTDVFKSLCKKCGVPVGKCANTKVKLDKVSKKSTTAYDTLATAISKTRSKTKKKYYPLDVKGKMCLIERKKHTVQWVLEVGVNITDYSYDVSIEDLITRAIVYSSKDKVLAKKTNTALEKKYGRRQETASVSDDKKAEIKKTLNNIFNSNGKPKKEIEITCIGNSEIITGKTAYIIIKPIGIVGTYYINSDSHIFENGSHTMSLKLSKT